MLESKVYHNQEISHLAKEAKGLSGLSLIIYVTLETYGISATRYIIDAIFYYDKKQSKKLEWGDLALLQRKIEALNFLHSCCKMYSKYPQAQVVHAIIKELFRDDKMSEVALIADLAQYPIAPHLKKKIIDYANRVSRLPHYRPKNKGLNQKSL